MKRNADDVFGATGEQDSTTGGISSLGAAGAEMAGNSDPSRPPVTDKLGQVKDRARALQSTLADRLDAGAEKLRQRNHPATLAAAGEGTMDVASEDRMTQVNDSVARGMQKSADWLRNGDLKADLERQVRDNPGRTLLIAVGVGYLLGKAFKRNR